MLGLKLVKGAPANLEGITMPEPDKWLLVANYEMDVLS